MLNPVFRREVRTVLRTWKTFIAIAVYILCLTGVVGLVLLTSFGNMYNGFNPQQTTEMYRILSGFQLGLILLIVPALTGGAISSERERQTFDLMLVTKMSTFSIVVGKLASSLLVVVLMIAAALPVFGIIMYYGGVSLANLLTMSLFFIVTAAVEGSIAIFFSALFKRTVVAIIATYFIVLALGLGSLFGVMVMGSLASRFVTFTSVPMLLIYIVLAVNPFVGFMGIVDSQLGSFTVADMVASFSYRFAPYAASPPTVISMPIWVPNTAFNIMLTVILIVLAAMLIRPMKKSKMYK